MSYKDAKGCLPGVTNPLDRPPNVIYLQWYDENGEVLNAKDHEVTWCEDRINPTDIMYVMEQQPDIVRAQHRALMELKEDARAEPPCVYPTRQE